MRAAFVVIFLLVLASASCEARAGRALQCPSAPAVPARAVAVCASLERHQRFVRRFGGHGFFRFGFDTTPATVDAVVAELALTGDDVPALRCLYDAGSARRSVRLMGAAAALLERVGPGAFDPDAACLGPLGP